MFCCEVIQQVFMYQLTPNNVWQYNIVSIKLVLEEELQVSATKKSILFIYLLIIENLLQHISKR